MTGIALLSVIALWSVSWTGTLAFDRLPGSIIPEVYKIHVEPNLVDHTFVGNVTIEILVKNETSMIVLHQQDLSIRRITMGDGIIVDRWNTLPDNDILIIYSNQMLQLHKTYYINVVYDGTLRSDRFGFFTSEYTDGEVTEWVAMTHLEPTGARLVFPCWDEPNFKAAFEISITHSRNYTTVLSNMPISSQLYKNETITTHFDRSTKMSTYLVAFVISNYTYLPQLDDRIRIYTRPKAVHQTEYACNFTVKALEVFDEYTGIPYFKHMPQLHQVTAPEFNPLGMENWGLVVYREEILLYEEGITTTAYKEIMIKTIVHELAHQWFGNLVTLQWWDYVWLNEGLSHYFEMYVVDKLEPTWRIKDTFVVDMMQMISFINDATADAQTMNKNVILQTQIWSKFNSVSYIKAACVIRMFSQILTEEVLHDGLKTYLNDYQLKNAISSDLLYRLGDAHKGASIYGGLSFIEIANSWVNQPGFPLVTVTKVSSDKYMLSQERFRDYKINRDDTYWWIPITYATKHEPNFTDISVTHWLPTTGDNIIISAPDVDWIVLNKQQIGYYRVNYDEETWHNLSNVLKTDMHKIHPVNRAQLIDDIFTLAHKNVTTYEAALSLTLYLTQEIDYVPWMATFRHLKTLRFKLFPAPHYETFKHYLKFIMRSLTTNVTYEASPNDDHLTKLLRMEAMHWACLAEVKECLDSAHKHFNAWLKYPHYKLDPDLESVIICTGLRTASQDEWDRARQILETVKHNPLSIKDNPLEVLGCSNNREILQKFLMEAMQTDLKIDFFDAAKGVLANTNMSGIDVVQNVLELSLQSDATDIDDFLDEATPLVPHIAAAVVNTDQFFKLSLLRTLIRNDPNAPTMLMDKPTKNILWVSAYADRIDSWLVENEQVFSSSGTLVFTSFLLILSIFMTRYF